MLKILIKSVPEKNLTLCDKPKFSLNIYAKKYSN